MDPAASITSNPPKSLAVFGLGQFGFAMAKIFNDKHPSIPVIAYDPVAEYVQAIQTTKQHPVFHPGAKLGDQVSATLDRFEAIKNADIILLAVPGQFVRDLLRSIAPAITRDVILLNVAKAVEQGTNKYLSVVASEEMGACKHNWWFATLSGGMIAEEVTKNWPIAADVACSDRRIAQYIADLFCNASFKLNTTDDVLGVELAGALKNVVAIGAGFYDGLEYEMSSKAAFVSEAAREVRVLVTTLGAKHATFDVGTHAWLGDLLTTCFGKSRNRYFGELLGKGMAVPEALAQLDKERKRSEGYLTSASFHQMAKNVHVSTPLLDTIYRVLHEGKSVHDAVVDFWAPVPKL